MQKGGRSDFIGQRIGGAYEIVAALGSGSSCDVYQAKHVILDENTIVALKLLRTHLDSQEAQDGFKKEAQLLHQLNHPSILPLLAAGFHTDDRPYIVTEYAPQGTLFDRLKQRQRQPFPLEEALTILIQISQGLQYAHHRNIVHRDLKPANILFNTRGEALLADFGIAIALPSEQTIRHVAEGTPQYMAPEQFDSLASKKSDVYALGCIAYELFTGHKAITIQADASDEWDLWDGWATRHKKQIPVSPAHYNPAIPRPLEEVILEALEKLRDDRPSIATFLARLQRFQVSSGAPATPPPVARLDLYSTMYDNATRILNHSPATTDQQAARQRFEEGNHLYEVKQYAGAVAAYEEATRLGLQDAGVYINKGIALSKLNRFEEALRAFNEAIRLNPGDATGFYNAANTLSHLKRYQEAVDTYTRTTDLDPRHINTYYNMGINLYLLQRYQEAITAYEQVIRLDARHTSAYYNMGNAYYCLERYKEAVKAYDHAIHLDAKHTRAYFRKSQALEALGWTDQARQARERAYQLGYTESP